MRTTFSPWAFVFVLLFCVSEPICDTSLAGDCGCPPCCSCPTWSFFGEALYLRARDAEVPYAVPIDGPIVPPPTPSPIQVGPVAIVDPDYEPGFRVGFGHALDCCTCVNATWTHYESSTADQTSIAAPDVIRSMVSHPSSQSAATDFLQAAAGYSLDFDLVDVDYRGILTYGQRYAVFYLIGGRYGRLQQDFDARFSALGTETVLTDIQFDGGGIRIGLDAERHALKHGIMVYARGVASFVAGEFRGSYFQGQTFDPTVVDTSWKAGRVVPMLDLEVGVGWTSPGGCLRFRAGYLFNAWYNVVKTDDLIRAVQTNNFLELGNTMSFDGLAARAEIRF